MKFFYYDLIFLIAFSLIVGTFLYRNRKKLQIESKIMLLYRTKFGLGFIEKISSRAPWFFSILANVSIITGYFLMIASVFLLVQTIIIIWGATNVPNIPPLMPLIPYLPEIFKIEFLPPFYFIYWIIAIAVIAIGHEFMHGVFARFYKVRLKSTGFGFLGPFLAAFVELDEKKMAKKPVKAQLAVLSGGSFANFVLAIIFFIMMNLFFMATFAQAGVIIPSLSISGITIPSYALNVLNASEVTYQNQPLNLTELSLINETQFKLIDNNTSYYLTREILNVTPKNSLLIIAYYDSPAFNAKIKGVITKINDNEIRNITDYEKILDNLKPRENITVETTEANYSITLAKHPENSSKAFFGIGIPQASQKSFFVGLIKKIMIKNDAVTYYAPKSDLAIFVYNLLLWIVLINISVMIINMLPFAIFDGGRFFYLSVFGLTKSRKKSIKWFNLANQMILIILVVMMVVWIVRII